MDASAVYALTPAGAQVHTLLGDATVSHHDLGLLHLPTGSLVASDPTSLSLTDEPLAPAVPAGPYPVELRVAELESGDQRTICAIVRFDNDEPDQWRAPASPSRRERAQARDEPWGYPIDSGTGSFCDARAVPLMRTLLDDWIDHDDRGLVIFDVMSEHYVSTWSWANVALDGETNIVAFSTGIGDGVGVTTFGFRHGRPLPVLGLTEFGLLDDGRGDGD